MTSSEILLKVKYNHPMLEFSRNNPSFKMLSWCNRESLVYEIVIRDPEEYSMLMKHMPKPTGVVAESYDVKKGHIIIKSFPCKNVSCARFFDGLAILHLQPTTIEKGWEYHRIVVFKKSALKKYLERIERAGYSFEILHKTPFRSFASTSLILEMNKLFSHLTKKQMEALLAAYRNGYYMWPRRMSAKAVASRMNVPKTTFRDHLKKAEAKLISDLIPYIHMFINELEKKN